MSPTEFWLEFDMRNTEKKTVEAARPGLGGISQAEWDSARKRHKEKMNGRDK